MKSHALVKIVYVIKHAILAWRVLSHNENGMDKFVMEAPHG